MKNEAKAKAKAPKLSKLALACERAATKARKDYVATVKGLDTKAGVFAQALNKLAVEAYGEEIAPWFTVRADSLPDAIRRQYEAFKAELSEEGRSSNTVDVYWHRTKDLGAKDALTLGLYKPYQAKVAEREAKAKASADANKAQKQEKREETKKALASAPRVTGKPTAGELAQKDGVDPIISVPEMSKASALSKLSNIEQARYHFYQNIRGACQLVKDTPDVGAEWTATADTIAKALLAMTPGFDALEAKVNRLRVAANQAK